MSKYCLGFLFVEFLDKNNVLNRLKFKVMQCVVYPNVRIIERGQWFEYKIRKARRNYIFVCFNVSETELLEKVREYFASKHGVLKDSISFRWEK
jgi:hypothetical protein